MLITAFSFIALEYSKSKQLLIDLHLKTLLPISLPKFFPTFDLLQTYLPIPFANLCWMLIV